MLDPEQPAVSQKAIADAAGIVGLAGAFQDAHADEGTVWLVRPDEGHLVACYNSGPDSGRIIGFQQALGKGIISMVFETEQSFCENGIQQNSSQDKRLDQTVGKTTHSLIAVPFAIHGETCGVISCVRLFQSTDGFTGRDLDLIAMAAQRFEETLQTILATPEP
jgi:transcriptional regulator with GAF, ATPase, and Fis domain